MSYLERLKNNEKTSVISAYKEAKKSKAGFKKDERFWTPTMDNMGNSYSVIRFLPRNEAEENEATAFVGPIYSHSFKNVANQYYIENCPQTFGFDKKCPVCDHNNMIKATYEKSIADMKTSDTKKKSSYVINILVIKDSAKPENNGKVFLYKMNKVIFNMMDACICPQFEDEEAYAPYDLFEGANFILKTKKQGKFISFVDSKFDARKPLSTDPEYLNNILKQVYSINEFVDESKVVKPYADLKRRFDLIMNVNSPAQSNNLSAEEIITEEELLKPSSDNNEIDSILGNDYSNDLPF